MGEPGRRWWLLLAVAPLVALADDGCLELLYFERPPYYQALPGGAVGGLVASRAAAALEAAGVCYRWRALPAKRHLAEIERNEQAACAVGWFRTAERERYARFSAPLYRDRPLVAVAARAAGLKERYRSAAELLAQGNRVLGLRAGFSYGEELDAAIARIAPRTYTTAKPVVHLLQMLERGRVDFVFMAREEADYLLARGEHPGLMLISFADLPAGNTRHLLCSRRTPEAVLERIDAAIRARWPE